MSTQLNKQELLHKEIIETTHSLKLRLLTSAQTVGHLEQRFTMLKDTNDNVLIAKSTGELTGIGDTIYNIIDKLTSLINPSPEETILPEAEDVDIEGAIEDDDDDLEEEINQNYDIDVADKIVE